MEWAGGKVEERERGLSGEDVKWMKFSPWKGLESHPPTAIGRFLAYRFSPRLATQALDTYINLDPFVLGLLIPDDGGSTHL
jgi:hypothetical protein